MGASLPLITVDSECLQSTKNLFLAGMKANSYTVNSGEWVFQLNILEREIQVNTDFLDT